MRARPLDKCDRSRDRRRARVTRWSATATTAARPYRRASGRRASAAPSASGAARSRPSSRTFERRTPRRRDVEEPQSQTPQCRTGFVRKGLERSVQATETLVIGIDNAGIPDTPQGEEAAEEVSDWARLGAATSSRTRRMRSTRRRTRSRRRSSSSPGRRRVRSGADERRADDRGVARLDPELAAHSRLEHLPGAAREGASREHDATGPGRVQGLVVIGFIALGVRSGGDRARALGRRRDARARLPLRSRSRRAADQRDAHHHRRHLGGCGDAGRGWHRLHGA